MPKKNQVFLLLGSNVHPRLEFIRKSFELLEQRLGKVLSASGLYESEPWGFEADTFFLNQVIQVQSDYSATEVHQLTRHIEMELGRAKAAGEGYCSRNIDIDLLYFNNEVIHSDDLVIPHRRLHERKFTLMPLVEIASGFIHPVFKVNQLELLKRCEDQGKVWHYQMEQA
jgi:2-amino-4-hydroxy-6-hydroxymethyldihydropteridine diphosphokinase